MCRGNFDEKMPVCCKYDWRRRKLLRGSDCLYGRHRLVPEQILTVADYFPSCETYFFFLTIEESMTGSCDWCPTTDDSIKIGNVEIVQESRKFA
jgi:hypothetical protein